MHLFALVSAQGTACHETCLCKDHFTPEHRKTAFEAGQQNTSDPSTDGWVECTDNDALKCIVCGFSDTAAKAALALVKELAAFRIDGDVDENGDEHMADGNDEEVDALYGFVHQAREVCGVE
jgi:hypothetical protein